MKEKLIIFGALILLVAVLAGLNAASYVQTKEEPDKESDPNRSSFNSGTTGTLAFHTLLAESGRAVTRWQNPISALGSEQEGLPSTFVVIGGLRREFTDGEAEEMLQWVNNGGQLILIDRDPPRDFLNVSGGWQISAEPKNVVDIVSADAADVKQMTADTPAVRPVQPSLFTARVNAVQPSRFASSINFAAADTYSEAPHESWAGERAEGGAPVVHFEDSERTVLVDLPVGSGSIVYLSDPYIVSNAGLALADNAQLAMNIVSRGNGLIAFDEYHHGYGAGDNRFLEYFAGTPVPAIFLQCVLIAMLGLISRSRRFARPVPENEADRLSKLEYVAAMAELQKRTRAYDLAMENIYADFRRRASRLFGVDNFSTKHEDLAALIAERTKSDRKEISGLLFKCEEIVRGEPTSQKEIVRLTGRLRDIEQKLGLTRSGVQTTLR